MNKTEAKEIIKAYIKKRLLVVCIASSFFISIQAVANDFPTNARAEYVFACMSTNGQSQIMLDKCSCSIDTIAEIMSYEEYVDAETATRMRLMAGERTAIFRDVEWVNKAVEKLRMAQSEAEIRCF